jgi:mannose-6-phosphate isomerase-like protein (cupin superfamily)
MKIVNWKNLEIVETPHKLDVRRLYDYDNAQVMHITLKPGESLKPHITPVDVFFFILEGAVDVRVGDETVTVETDNLVESPKDIVHCISNNSADLSRVLVVKSPKPKVKARVL